MSRWSEPCSVLGFEPGTDGKPIIKREPKLLLNDDKGGKPEGIHLVIGRRPHFAFGNTPGDQQMLDYTTAGSERGLGMLVLHDDGVARIRLWASPGSAQFEGRDIFRRNSTIGEQERVDRRQHEERLEADLRVRVGLPDPTIARGAWRRSVLIIASGPVGRRRALPKQIVDGRVLHHGRRQHGHRGCAQHREQHRHAPGHLRDEHDAGDRSPHDAGEEGGYADDRERLGLDIQIGRGCPAGGSASGIRTAPPRPAWGRTDRPEFPQRTTRGRAQIGSGRRREWRRAARSRSGRSG